MKTAEMILFGRTGQERRSGHVNPVVKVLLLAAPLGVVVYQQVGRAAGWRRLGIADVLIVAVIMFLAAIINFSERERARTMKRAVAGTMFFGGLFYVAAYPETGLAHMMGFVSQVYHVIPLVRGISAESWLYFVFIYIAINAAADFNSRDVLWLGRRVLSWWNGLFVSYVVVVTTFCVINSALPLRLGLSWRIAADKATLLKNPGLGNVRWRFRIVKRWQIFAMTLIWNNSAIAQSIQLLCDQRRFFRQGYTDVIGRTQSVEDTVALMLYGVGLVVLVAPRL